MPKFSSVYFPFGISLPYMPSPPSLVVPSHLVFPPLTLALNFKLIGFGMPGFLSEYFPFDLPLPYISFPFSLVRPLPLLLKLKFIWNAMYWPGFLSGCFSAR